MKLDVLFIGTHPDDVELFCGGTVLKLTERDIRCGILDLTRGELSSRGSLESRADEARKAASILKVAVRENAHLNDGNIENSPENRLKVIEKIRAFQPGIVFIPFGEDRHPDHANASKLLVDALFYSGLHKIETNHPTFRPNSVIYYFSHWIRQPAFLVDISAQFADKIKAIKTYKTQFSNKDKEGPETYISQPSFLQSIENRARYFGDQIGVQFAEPFYTKGPIKIDNIMECFA